MLEILQRASVNIASMNVARSVGSSVKITASSGSSDSDSDFEETASASAGGSAAVLVRKQESAAAVPMALCFMALDDDVPPPAMAALHSLTFLHDVAKIQLK